MIEWFRGKNNPKQSVYWKSFNVEVVSLVAIMVVDSQTNFLYLADSLPKAFPSFTKAFLNIINEAEIPFAFLPGTKDVWAVDYMPIQLSEDNYLQFTYQPDYLQDQKGQQTITDVTTICQRLKISPTASTIVLDGGNVVKASNKVILCDKVLKENPRYTKTSLADELKMLFNVEQIIFVPRQPYDFIGHADGMVRFVTSDTVLVNDYSNESKRFQDEIKGALKNAGLTTIDFPYSPYHNKHMLDATGTYINYLEMQDIILLPVFGLKEDGRALSLLNELFFNKKVISIISHDVAKHGGVLNCISWNIFVESHFSASFSS